jgi:sugar lactone lactonase YvrE
MKSISFFLICTITFITACKKKEDATPTTPAGISYISTAVVTTFAGSGASGAADATGTAASFSLPTALVFDASGNLFVADATNNMIRKITPAGVVSTLAGSGASGTTDGTGAAATFNHPTGIVIDASGNLFVSDFWDQTIRKITAAGEVTTFAGTTESSGTTDGTGSAARFNGPAGLAIDSHDNIYVADYLSNTIRKITPAGVVTTFAGSGTAGSLNGTGTDASFRLPSDIAIDANDNLFVVDYPNNMIRKITPNGVVTTFAGSINQGFANGTGTDALFTGPYGIAIDASGNLYITEINGVICKITSTGVVTALAGTGKDGSANGTGIQASFNSPLGIEVNKTTGDIYVSDSDNNLIRKIVQ